MAKRRAVDDIFINTSPKKCRGLCNVDMRLEKVAFSGASQPSLHALLGSRSKKRPFYFDETGETDFDMAHFRKNARGDQQMKHDLNTVHQQTSGNVQKPRNSANKSTNKRARSDCEVPADSTNSEVMVKVDAKIDNEDSSFNSFQFWRIPLPELDMSLLQEPPKKDSSSEEMET